MGGFAYIIGIPESIPIRQARGVQRRHEKSRNKMRLLKLLVGATMSRQGRALHGQTVTNAPQLWPSHNEGKMRTKFKSASHEKNKKRPKVVVYYFSGRGEREPVIFCKTPENQPFLSSTFPNFVKMSYTLYHTFLLVQL